MIEKSQADEDAEVLAKFGGDARILKLFEIALTAYKFLPADMFNFKTWVSTRENIMDVIKSFGFRPEPIPWERFPKRFHKNRPELLLFKPTASDATVEKHWKDSIAAQTPDAPKTKARKSRVKVS